MFPRLAAGLAPDDIDGAAAGDDMQPGDEGLVEGKAGGAP
jgi:hypothetical protein